MRRRRQADRRARLPRDAAGGSVVRAAVSGAEWLLAAPPAGSRLGPADLRLLAGRLLAAAPPWQPGEDRLTIARVPPPLLDDRLGPAVLRWHGGRGVAYCADTQVTARAAEGLTALASRAVLLAPPAAPGLGVAAVKVTPVAHRLLPSGLHPAAGLRRPEAITFAVCAELITPGLAAALTLLFSAGTAGVGTGQAPAGRPSATAAGSLAGPDPQTPLRPIAGPGTARRLLGG